MAILFDENGYLKPYEPIEMTLDDFEQTFVFNAQRKDIFNQYQYFLSLLKRMPIGTFHQWVNGSFISRKAFPNDIDLVSFVDANFYRIFEGKLLDLAQEFKDYRVDAYFEPVFPTNHILSAATRYNTADWKYLYGHDKRSRRKGFVSIKF